MSIFLDHRYNFVFQFFLLANLLIDHMNVRFRTKTFCRQCSTSPKPTVFDDGLTLILSQKNLLRLFSIRFTSWFLVEIMVADFPEYSQIETAKACEWIFESANVMALLRRIVLRTVQPQNQVDSMNFVPKSMTQSWRVQMWVEQIFKVNVYESNWKNEHTTRDTSWNGSVFL